jgi:peptide-methionine (S)-S-oxide reductase
VGYAGGNKPNPTYTNLDGYAETIQVDYDPARITYEQLLNVFWHSHNPEVPAWSWQYASIIFYHNPEQLRQAEETKFHVEETLRKVKVHTLMIHFTEFYRAEDYHQKYWLQASPELMQDFRRIYPDFKDFVNSTAAARVNGIMGGYATIDGTMEELGSYGLSQESNQILVNTVRRLERKLDKVRL